MSADCHWQPGRYRLWSSFCRCEFPTIQNHCFISADARQRDSSAAIDKRLAETDKDVADLLLTPLSDSDSEDDDDDDDEGDTDSYLRSLSDLLKISFPRLVPEFMTPTIEDVNTAILMGASADEVQKLLLRGDPPLRANQTDKIGLSPIHIACLIPEGLYEHTPLSVVKMLLAAGASVQAEAGLSVSIQDKKIPITPYNIAAFTRNTSTIRYFNSHIKIEDKTKLAYGKTAAQALTLACSNLDTGGPIVKEILDSDIYPLLRTIYTGRTKAGASSRYETLKAIIELEEKCRGSNDSWDWDPLKLSHDAYRNTIKEAKRVLDGAFQIQGDGYGNMVKEAKNVLEQAFSMSLEEKERDMELIDQVLST